MQYGFMHVCCCMLSSAYFSHSACTPGSYVTATPGGSSRWMCVQTVGEQSHGKVDKSSHLLKTTTARISFALQQPHWLVQLFSAIWLQKPNICEPICKLSLRQQNATEEKERGSRHEKKNNKQNVPQSVTGAQTNPIICVSCCKFVLMVGVRK